uniref:Putative ovule protein n=1 Tax=Solanum chacoense TaxID=4108 RepID=A0A0V0IIM1_SOLCH
MFGKRELQTQEGKYSSIEKRVSSYSFLTRLIRTAYFLLLKNLRDSEEPQFSFYILHRFCLSKVQLEPLLDFL